MKKIIALVGPLAAGKDVTKKYLEEKYGAQSIKFSQIFRDILNRLNIENNRENLQNVSTSLRKLFGEDLLAKVIVKDLENSNSEIVILDGVRRLSDIQYVKDLENFNLISIDAELYLRYERLKLRKENEGDDKKTFEEFIDDHNREADREVPEVMKIASLKIENNGNFDDLYKKIDLLISNIFMSNLN